jgi:hypothetical protein
MMTKTEALQVFATAFVRELLRENDEPARPVAPPLAEKNDPDTPPQPRFDFDASNEVCEHGGVYFERAACPVHGQSAQEEVTTEELDDIASEETPNQLKRAERLRKQRDRQAKTERLFPEDLPMSGLAPPEELP